MNVTLQYKVTFTVEHSNRPLAESTGAELK
jgi:hypothetical protein